MLVVTQDGDSALMLAVIFRHKNIAEILIDKGANLDLQNQVRYSHEQ